MTQADWMPSLGSPIQTPQKNHVLGPFLLNRQILLGFFQIMLLIALSVTAVLGFWRLFLTSVFCGRGMGRMRCGLSKGPGSRNSVILTQLWDRLSLHPGLITELQCLQLPQFSETAVAELIKPLQKGIAPGLLHGKQDDTITLASPADFDRKRS